MTKTHLLNPASPLWDKVINTKTNAEWNELMKFFDEHGITWGTVDKASSKHYWHDEKTVVYLWYRNGSLSWGGRPRPEEKTIGVYEYINIINDFILANNLKQSPVLSIKDQTMSTQKLTPFLEKSLTATQKNYYKLGWIAVDSADLRVTSEGQRALAQVMLIGEGDVAKFAASEVKRLEAEAKV